MSSGAKTNPDSTRHRCPNLGPYECLRGVSCPSQAPGTGAQGLLSVACMCAGGWLDNFGDTSMDLAEPAAKQDLAPVALPPSVLDAKHLSPCAVPHGFEEAYKEVEDESTPLDGFNLSLGPEASVEEIMNYLRSRPRPISPIRQKVGPLQGEFNSVTFSIGSAPRVADAKLMDMRRDHEYAVRKHRTLHELRVQGNVEHNTKKRMYAEMAKETAREVLEYTAVLESMTDNPCAHDPDEVDVVVQSTKRARSLGWLQSEAGSSGAPPSSPCAEPAGPRRVVP